MLDAVNVISSIGATGFSLKSFIPILSTPFLALSPVGVLPLVVVCMVYL